MPDFSHPHAHDMQARHDSQEHIEHGGEGRLALGVGRRITRGPRRSVDGDRIPLAPQRLLIDALGNVWNEGSQQFDEVAEDEEIEEQEVKPPAPKAPETK